MSFATRQAISLQNSYPASPNRSRTPSTSTSDNISGLLPTSVSSNTSIPSNSNMTVGSPSSYSNDNPLLSHHIGSSHTSSNAFGLFARKMSIGMLPNEGGSPLNQYHAQQAPQRRMSLTSHVSRCRGYTPTFFSVVSHTFIPI